MSSFILEACGRLLPWSQNHPSSAVWTKTQFHYSDLQRLRTSNTWQSSLLSVWQRLSILFSMWYFQTKVNRVLKRDLLCFFPAKTFFYSWSLLDGFAWLTVWKSYFIFHSCRFFFFSFATTQPKTLKLESVDNSGIL